VTFGPRIVNIWYSHGMSIPDFPIFGQIGNLGFPSFPIFAESGIGDSLPDSRRESPIPGQIGNRGNGNWGFPGLGGVLGVGGGALKI
jgi:hypothetical protein